MAGPEQQPAALFGVQKLTYYTAGQFAVRHLLDIDQTTRTVGEWMHSDIKATGAIADLVGILAGFAAAKRHGDDPAAIFEQSGDLATVAVISTHFWPDDSDGTVSKAAELAGALMSSSQVWRTVELFAGFLESFPSTAPTLSHHAHEALQ